jgi:magnesium chelatase family protein
MLLIGPPGAGKSMLAHRLPGILPPLTTNDALETALIASANSQGFRAEEWSQRPFRAPHHTSSTAALVGGGSQPSPGEISLAHHGGLFLDELPEFERETLETLREPLETARASISLVDIQMTYIYSVSRYGHSYCATDRGRGAAAGAPLAPRRDEKGELRS